MSQVSYYTLRMPYDMLEIQHMSYVCIHEFCQISYYIYYIYINYINVLSYCMQYIFICMYHLALHIKDESTPRHHKNSFPALLRSRDPAERPAEVNATTHSRPKAQLVRSSAPQDVVILYDSCRSVINMMCVSDIKR